MTLIPQYKHNKFVVSSFQMAAMVSSTLRGQVEDARNINERLNLLHMYVKKMDD